MHKKRNSIKVSSCMSVLFSYTIACHRETSRVWRAHPTLLEGLTCWFTTGARILTWMNGWKMQLRYDSHPVPFICLRSASRSWLHPLFFSGGASEQTRSEHRGRPLQVRNWTLFYLRSIANLFNPLMPLKGKLAVLSFVSLVHRQNCYYLMHSTLCFK